MRRRRRRRRRPCWPGARSCATRPVAGLKTGAVRVELPVAAAPSIQWLRVGVSVDGERLCPFGRKVGDRACRGRVGERGRGRRPRRRSPAPRPPRSSVTTQGGTTWMRLSGEERQQVAGEQLGLDAAHHRGADRLAGLGVGHQLERPEDAHAAHLADDRVLRRQRRQARARARRRRSGAAFSTMPSASIASSAATIDAIASGCPL